MNDVDRANLGAENPQAEWPVNSSLGDAAASAWVSVCGLAADNEPSYWHNASHWAKKYAPDAFALRLAYREATYETPQRAGFALATFTYHGQMGLAGRIQPFAVQAETKSKHQREKLKDSLAAYLKAAEPVSARGSGLRLEIGEDAVRAWVLDGAEPESLRERLVQQSSWQDAVVEMARGTEPGGPLAIIAEFQDEAAFEALPQLVELAYPAGAHLAVVLPESVDLRVDQQVLDWLEEHILAIPVVRRARDGYHYERWLGEDTALGRAGVSSPDLAGVLRWLRMQWLMEQASAPGLADARMFELSAAVAAADLGRPSRHTAELFRALVSTWPVPSTYSPGMERLATSLSNAGHYRMAVVPMESTPRATRSTTFVTEMERALYGSGEFEEVGRLRWEAPRSAKAEHVLAESDAAAQLLERLAKTTDELAAPAEADGPLRVVSILQASAPQQLDGYTHRAHHLLAGMTERGLRVLAVTRPGFPGPLEPGDGWLREVYDEVRYHRLGAQRLREDGDYQYMVECVDEYKRFLTDATPDVVHLRSTHLSALPALIAARELGIPTVYEVTGLWELFYAASDDAEDIGRQARAERMENAALSRATRLAALTGAMAQELAGRVGADVAVVPNAVEPTPEVEDVASLKTQWGWAPDVPVVGLIGSFVPYEGLDLLIRALAELRDRDYDLRALLVGSGPELELAEALITEHGLSDLVKVVARNQLTVNPYAIADVLTYPRRSLPSTELVSSPKPLQALAAGKPIVVSDVAALREIVGADERGLVVPTEDSTALAEAIARLLDEPELRERLGLAGKQWVEQHHTWDAVINQLTDLLREVAAQRPAPVDKAEPEQPAEPEPEASAE